MGKKRDKAAKEDERALLLKSSSSKSSSTFSQIDRSNADDSNIESGRSRLRAHNRDNRAWKRVSARTSHFFGFDDDANTRDEGMMILNTTNKSKSHMNSVWFHGRLNRDVTEKKLKEFVRENGRFLIRQNMKGDYVLSMIFQRKYLHFAIITTSKYFALGSAGVKYRSLNDLVDAHHQDANGLPCSLKNAVSRKDNGFIRNLSKRLSRRKMKYTIHNDDCDIKGKNSKRSKVPKYEEVFDSDHEESQYRERIPRAENPNSSNSTVLPSSDGSRQEKGTRSKPRCGHNDDVEGGILIGRGKKYEVVALDTHTPWFIRLISIAQIVVIFLLVVQSKINIRNISFKPDVIEQDIQRGFSLQPVPMTITLPVNVFIGPDSATLIKKGAKYNPCMRKDTAVFAQLAKENEKELDYGCCVLDDAGYESCGMVVQSECPPSASFLGVGQSCPSTCAEYRVRPCCTGTNGTCEVTTQDHCRFIRGIWNHEAALCSEVSCIQQRCGFSMANGDRPNQWYRFFSSVFVHAGIIHVIIVSQFQWSFGALIEKKVGFLRTFIMYTISCVGGNLVSGIFSPQLPGLGAGGAMVGFLGIYMVDLMESWQVKRRPYRNLILTILSIVFFFLVGTLPWVDNYAHLGGFMFGTLSAAVFLPYVTFGTGDKWRKRIALIICLVLLTMATIVGLVLFYQIQSPTICPSCDVFQCYNWVANLCDST
eukprot:m.114754 g.114754  ORF g.114754 m.114754 type:complete len:706 (+) comp9283_c0_seq5:153-2270(+)